MTITKDKISRRQTTNYNHYEKCLSTVKSLYNMAECYQLTHDKMLENRNEYLYKKNSFKRLTTYYRGKLRGFEDCLFGNLFRYHLIWLFSYTKQGKRIFTDKWENMPEDIRYDSKCFTSAYYWRKSWEEKDLKLFA